MNENIQYNVQLEAPARRDKRPPLPRGATTSCLHRETRAIVCCASPQHLFTGTLKQTTRPNGGDETRDRTHYTLTHTHTYTLTHTHTDATHTAAARGAALTESKLTRAKMAKVEMLSHTHLVLNEWTGTALQLRADHEPSREELHGGGGREEGRQGRRGAGGMEGGRGGERLAERRGLTHHVSHVDASETFVDPHFKGKT